MRSNPRLVSTAALVFPLLAASWAAPAAADHCSAEWNEAVVCSLEIDVDIEEAGHHDAPSVHEVDSVTDTARDVRNARTGSTRPGAASPVASVRTVTLAPHRVATLSLTARDQWGGVFPSERMAYELELDDACHGLVEVERQETGVYQLTTEGVEGRCEITVWVPGNLNLDTRIDLQVREPRAPMTRAARITQRLYLALLGREPNERGLAAGEEAIEAGRIESYVRGLVTSDEFSRRRTELPPPQLLDSIYEGLLGRGVDASGRQAYGDEIARGRITEVVLAILRSAEFRRSLEEGMGPRLHHRVDESRRDE